MQLRNYLCCLLVLLGSRTLGHDIKNAMFEISAVPGGYSIFVSFDRYDLEQCMKSTYPELSGFEDKAAFEDYTNEYLMSNFQISFDEECPEISINGYEYDEEYIRLQTFASTSNTTAKNINITNTCLIACVEGHSNIIKATLYDRSRLFRLSRDRHSTVISY